MIVIIINRVIVIIGAMASIKSITCSVFYLIFHTRDFYCIRVLNDVDCGDFFSDDYVPVKSSLHCWSSLCKFANIFFALGSPCSRGDGDQNNSVFILIQDTYTAKKIEVIC